MALIKYKKTQNTEDIKVNANISIGVLPSAKASLSILSLKQSSTGVLSKRSSELSPFQVKLQTQA